jgi:hypothetical protein
MGSIHLIGGEKGGVGKSLTSRLVAQFYIDHKIPFVAFDGDASHGTLHRTYAEVTEPLRLDDDESLDRIAEHALDPDRRVLVDLPAQASRALRTWIEGADVLAFAREHRIAIHLWHVTDGGYDSVQLLGNLTREYDKDLRTIVVRNHGRSHDFSQLDESEALASVRGLGGHVIDLPELQAAAMYRIDRHGSSFWAAVNDTESELRLPPLDRRRVRKWLQDAYQQLDRLPEL